MQSAKNTKILILAPYPEGTAPGQRFRYEHYLPLLDQENISYDYHTFFDYGTYKILYTSGHMFKKILGVLKGFIRRFKHVYLSRNYDYIFIFREVSPIGGPVFEWIMAVWLSKKIIYDFDDAIWLSDPSEKKLISFVKWKSKVGLICKWSHKVVVGNSFLANYARQKNASTFIIPTVVNASTYHVPSAYVKENKIPVIGWTGTHSTLPYLQSIMPVLRDLRDIIPFNFLIIANKNPNYKDDFVIFEPWNKMSEIEDLQKIDIGIMPLTKNLWSEGKCGFKIIQYLSLGIPAVASDVGVNKEIISDGENGYICQSKKDWINALRILLTDHQKRKLMGENGRLKVIKQYSVQSTFKDFLNLFTS